MSNTENSSGATSAASATAAASKTTLEKIKEIQKGNNGLDPIEDLLIQVFRSDFLKVTRQDSPEAKEVGIDLLNLLVILEEVIGQRRRQVAACHDLQKVLQGHLDEASRECRARYFGLSAVVKLINSVEAEIDIAEKTKDWSKMNKPLPHVL